MSRVVAPSRLHFGLLHVPTDGVTHWPDGLPMRRFGGLGLMVRDPAIIVHVEPAIEWQAEGPCSTRALGFAEKCTAFLGDFTRFRITVEACPHEHVGLGVGTQLGLAVAKAVAGELGRSEVAACELARWIGRGERSGIGVHGFERGGFIVDGGKADAKQIGLPLGVFAFPNEWRILLVRPSVRSEWYGARERNAFARPRSAEMVARNTERMCRVAMLGVLPALLERDVSAFGDALTEYNRLAGEAFAMEQGGIYSSPEVSELVEIVGEYGVHGAGQSSWGPTVFAVCETHDQARTVTEAIRHRFDDVDVIITTASISGAVSDAS